MSDPRSDSERRPEELDILPGITGEKVEKTYAQGNTGGLLIDPDDGTIGEAVRDLEQALHDRVQENEQLLDEIEHPERGQREQAVGEAARPAPAGQAGPSATAGTNIDQAGELPNSSTGAVGVGRAGVGAGGGRGRGSDTGGSYGTSGHGPGDNLGRDVGSGTYSGGSQGSSPSGGLTGKIGTPDVSPRTAGPSPAGGVAVNAGRGSDVGSSGPTMRDDLGGGVSGGTTGGARERDAGGGLSGAMRTDVGSGRDPDLDSAKHPREQRPVGTQDDDQPKE